MIAHEQERPRQNPQIGPAAPKPNEQSYAVRQREGIVGPDINWSNN
jgi:hypothetical protein